MPHQASKTASPKFSLGQTVATPAALKVIRQAGRTPNEFIARHQQCDWGDLDKEDQQTNDEALKDGSRLLSAYELGNADRIWVITEAVDDSGERAATTILLSEEY